MTARAHRRGLVGAACHVAWLASLTSLGFAEVGVPWWTPVVLLAASGLAGLLASQGTLPASIGVTWFVLTFFHHYGIGIDPRWFGAEVEGIEHVLWDVGFHLPPLAVLVAELWRWPSTQPHRDRSTGATGADGREHLISG